MKLWLDAVDDGSSVFNPVSFVLTALDGDPEGKLPKTRASWTLRT